MISGFEPLDVLQSVWMLLKQIDEGRCEVENQYQRIVPRNGNPVALGAVTDVFELREFFEWRGLGSIDHSGVRMREVYAPCDAEKKFPVARNLKIADPKSCQCGEVLKGVIKPLGMQGVRQGVHARDAAGRADGVHRGRLRRLLPVRPHPAGRLGSCSREVEMSEQAPTIADRRHNAALSAQPEPPRAICFLSRLCVFA